MTTPKKELHIRLAFHHHSKDDDEEGGENSGKNNANANDYVVPAFSAQAKQLIKAKLRAAAASGGDEAEGDENNQEDDDDEEMLVDNIEQM